ncbi:hypothetical protein C5E44_29415 [Nocardia nova]|nr:hypothetical protein C5E44_29415 [Nocardia nova]
MKASFEVLVRFVFGDDETPPLDAEVIPFVQEHGLDYAFGYLRAALADDLRVFGFPPGVMPVNALEEPKQTGIAIARPDDETVEIPSS